MHGIIGTIDIDELRVMKGRLQVEMGERRTGPGVLRD